MWEIEFTDEFGQWWATLSQPQQEALTAAVDVLGEFGPGLGRPLVDQIRASRHQHLKELRVSKGGALRVLFAFDPTSGGDPAAGWRQDRTVARVVPRVGAAR
jgi:hypothetical protein